MKKKKKLKIKRRKSEKENEMTVRKTAHSFKKDVKKVSVLFPDDLLRKIKMVALMRQENTSQAIVRLTMEGLKKEMGTGEANLDLLDQLVGSIPAGAML